MDSVLAAGAQETSRLSRQLAQACAAVEALDAQLTQVWVWGVLGAVSTTFLLVNPLLRDRTGARGTFIWVLEWTCVGNPLTVLTLSQAASPAIIMGSAVFFHCDALL